MTKRHAYSLQVKNLSYHFETKQVLHDINLSLLGGDCGILLGPNAAGKTTLFSLLAGLYAGGGQVLINGFDIKNRPYQALSQLGVVFQQSTLDMDLSVLQNLNYHAALHGMSGKTARLRIDEELEQLGLLESKDEKIRTLNGGHRRRVEIARALIHKPSLLLLDEPTAGLDIPTRQALVEHLHNLCSQGAVSILWATHLIDEVYPTDKVIVLNKGRIEAQGQASAICQTLAVDNLAAAYQTLTGES